MQQVMTYSEYQKKVKEVALNSIISSGLVEEENKVRGIKESTLYDNFEYVMAHPDRSSINSIFNEERPYFLNDKKLKMNNGIIKVYSLNEKILLENQGFIFICRRDKETKNEQ